MVNFRQVLDLDVAAIGAFADRWHAISEKLGDSRREFDERVTKPLERENWKGEAGSAAKNRCAELSREIGAVAKQARGVRAYMDKNIAGDWENESLRKLKEEAQRIHASATANGMRISDDGEVTAEAGGDPRQAEALAKQVDAVVQKATKADEFIAEALRVIFGTTENFDSESRAFGSDRDETGWTDTVTKKKLQGVELMMRHKYEWTEAADLLDHWLSGSGKPYEVDAGKMLRDMPNFQKDVNADLAEVKKGPDGEFATKWSDSKPKLEDGPSNLNWYYALNHFEYRLVGEKADGEVDYEVEVRKQYDWGTPSEHRADLQKGPVHLEQADIAHLHSAGMARDFQVHGKTGEMTA